MSRLIAYQLKHLKQLAWFLPLLLVLLVHSSVYSTGFRYDDFTHLYKMANWPLFDVIGAQNGGHLLQSYNLVVWLVQKLFGSVPAVFLCIALFLHLVSTILLYLISDTLTQRKTLSLFIALLWGMSPLAHFSLVWISVHGQVYATTAVLWVFYDVARYSTKDTLPGIGSTLRHLVLLLIAATSFGTGLAVAFAFFVVIALWPKWRQQLGRSLCIYLLFSLLLLLLFVQTQESQSTSHSNWNLYEESLVSTLIDPRNLVGTLMLLGKLLLVGFTGLLLGPLFSRDFVPVEDMVAIATWFGVLVIFPGIIVCWFSAEKAARRQLAVLLVLATAAYGIIAIARQPIDAAGFFTVSVATGPRYHYLSTAFLAIAAGVGLNAVITTYASRHKKTGLFIFSLWLLILIGPYIDAAQPVDNASDKSQDRQFQRMVAVIEKAARRNRDSDIVVIENIPFSLGHMGIQPDLLPGLAGFYIAMYPENYFEERQVIFVEKSSSLVESIRKQRNTRASRIIKHQSEL